MTCNGLPPFGERLTGPCPSGPLLRSSATLATKKTGELRMSSACSGVMWSNDVLIVSVASFPKWRRTPYLPGPAGGDRQHDDDQERDLRGPDPGKIDAPACPPEAPRLERRGSHGLPGQYLYVRHLFLRGLPDVPREDAPDEAVPVPNPDLREPLTVRSLRPPSRNSRQRNGWTRRNPFTRGEP